MATYVQEIQHAGRPTFFQYAVTATATALSASTVLNTNRTPRRLTVKNADGAANIAYLGSSDVAATPTEAGVELGAGDSFTFEGSSPSEIYAIGTAAAANILFICAEW